MSREIAVVGICPLCGKTYTVKNNRTRHHILPSYWVKKNIYHGKKNVTVYACEECHEKEFNYLYPMRLKEPWSKAECVINWIKFCLSKGKDPLKIYPQLHQFFN